MVVVVIVICWHHHHDDDHYQHGVDDGFNNSTFHKGCLESLTLERERRLHHLSQMPLYVDLIGWAVSFEYKCGNPIYEQLRSKVGQTTNFFSSKS